MSGLSKEQFLGRIREALGRSGPLAQAPQPPALDPAFVRLRKAGPDTVEFFAQKAAKTGMTVVKCRAGDFRQKLAEVFRENGVKTFTLGLKDAEEENQLSGFLTGEGFGSQEWRGDRTMHPHYDVDAGICDVQAAVAETGTLVCCSGERLGRGLSLVPPIHVAIVKASDVVPDIYDYWDRVADVPGADLPSAQALIAGPSKTADIEGILITGVHGPKKVYILLIDGA